MSAYTQDLNLDPQTESELGRAAVQVLRRLLRQIDANAIAKAFVRSHAEAFDAYRRAQVIVSRMHKLDLAAGRVKVDRLGWCEECGQVHEIEMRAQNGGAS